MTELAAESKKTEISNTLSRWHKIAQRVRAAGQKVQAEITAALNAGAHLDSDTFEIRKTKLQSETTFAVTEKLSQYKAMQDTLFKIRKSVNQANLSHGVSDLLNQIERVKQEREFYNAIIISQEHLMSTSDYAQLAARRSKSESTRYHSAAVTFLSSEKLAEMIVERDALAVKLNQLADMLSDANATKLKIFIDESVAKVVGI